MFQDYNDEIRQEQMREMQIINSTGSVTSANGGTPGSISNNGTVSGSEEGSVSPHSSGSPPPQGTTPTVGATAGLTLAGLTGGKSGGVRSGAGGNITTNTGASLPPSSASVGLTLSQPHPALRGLTRVQTAVLAQGWSLY